MGVTNRAAPSDEGRFVTTYGYVRQLARQGDLIREGYSESVRRGEVDPEMRRDWALSLERLDPAGRGTCPGCGRRQSCSTRRDVLRIRRDSIAKQELRYAEHVEHVEHVERIAQTPANMLASIQGSRLP